MNSPLRYIIVRNLAMVRLAFKRMGQEWRILAILLFAISLVTGFLALGPLYIRGVTEVDIRYALDNADEEDLNITLISEQPLGENEQAIVERELGGLITDVDRYVRADYTPPQPSGNQAPGITGIAACGFLFQLGQNPFLGTPPSPNCYQPYAFDDLADRVVIIEGRLPERSAPPAEVSGSGVSDENQEFNELGWYNRGQVEAVITSVVAEEAEIEIGSRFFMGNIFLDGSGALTSVKIVGVVEAIDPNDPFWAGNGMFLTGADIPIGNTGATRFDFGLAFDPVSYEDWVAPVVPGTSYIWRMDTDPKIITANNAGDVTSGIDSVRNQVRENDPTAQIFSGYTGLISGYGDRVQEAEGPIVFLSGAVLILLLYHLVTTVSLVLQQQGKEWSTLTARGGSTGQLFVMQFVTIAILGVLSFGAAFGISRLFLFFMEEFGPLSDVLGEASLVNVALPLNSVWLALAGAVVATIVLSAPSIPAASKSLLSLKQSASRPPTRRNLMHILIMLACLGIGALFLFRLYLLASPDDASIDNLVIELVTNPQKAIDTVAENATSETGLNDPFNLVGPAFFLTGMALLWLSIFPTLVGFISRFTSRSRHLTTPLAVWNVQRDPGHYAQLVLLLIGTLALGTASLGLSATRDAGAWEVATTETGSAVRVDVDTSADIADRPWDRLDGVESYAQVMNVNVRPSNDRNSRTIQVIGLDAEAFAKAYPEHRDKVEALIGQETIGLPGLPLDIDARQLQVQVWSNSIAEEDLPEANVELNIYLVDEVGIPFTVTLSRPTVDTGVTVVGDVQTDDGSNQFTPAEEWVTLIGNLPVSGRAPYSIYQIGIATRQGELSSFSHTMYLDYWQTVDENGVTTDFETFEIVPDAWQPALAENVYITANDDVDIFDSAIGGLEMNYVAVADENIAPVSANDTTALKIDYTIRRVVAQSSEPRIAINPVIVAGVPAIVSNDFAENFKNLRQGGSSSSGANQPDLRVGDYRPIDLNIGPGTVSIGLQILDIQDAFPTVLSDKANFIILPLETARLWFNQTARPNSTFDANEIWLNVPDRQVTSQFENEIGQVEGVNDVVYAWDRYGQILREPLPSAIAGMLFAGFWISLALSLLDFAFYLAVTAQQRAFTFGVLRSLGWNANSIWQLLFVEQVTLIAPALVIGSILGAGLAYLILPFLSLVGNETLRLPTLGIIGLLATLVISFTILLSIAALWLRQMSVNQVLRLGEE